MLARFAPLSRDCGAILRIAILLQRGEAIRENRATPAIRENRATVATAARLWYDSSVLGRRQVVKASGFEPDIRTFESCRPSSKYKGITR